MERVGSMIVSTRVAIPVCLGALVTLAATGASAATTSITYASWYQNPEDVQLVKRFNELNPNIKVSMTVTAPASDAKNWMRGWVEKIVVSAIGGKAPDVMRINHETVIPFYQAGLLADLSPHIKKAKFRLDDYFAPNVDLYKVKGKQVGIPLSVNNYAIFYNRKMLAEAGVADLNQLASQGDWTREGYLAAAKKLTRDTNGDRKIDIYGIDDSPFWTGRDVYVPQAGGRMFTPDGKRCIFNSAETVDGLKFMADMKFVHKAWRPEGWASGVWERKTAMTMGAGWVINRCLDAKIDFNVAPVFQYKAKKWFPAAGDGIGVSSTSKKKDAAWRFVQFMSGPEAESQQAKAGIITPALISTAMGDAFAKSGKAPHNAEAFFSTIENTAVFEPRFIRNEQSIFDLVMKAYDDLWSGKKSAQKVAEELQSSANRLL